MIKRLEEAFAQAATLPEDEQEALAEWLLAELASDRRWRKSLAGSPDILKELADEARAEHVAERTEQLDPEGL